MNFMLLAITYSAMLAALVAGHGRLLSPPARSTMWRFGWNTKANYDDNQMFCGGKTTQINLGGKCGICGDPWDEPVPRKTEIGGPYYKGYIVANYTVGQVIEVEVQLTANHMGFFQFKICPVPGFNTEATQDCLDEHLLTLAGTSHTNYQVKKEDRKLQLRLQLPPDVNCEHCVFQWRYHAGNSWGRCADGTGAVGCGPQEEFYGCSDVAVLGGGSRSTYRPPVTARTSHTTASRGRPTSTRRYTTTRRTTTTTTPSTTARAAATTRRAAATTASSRDGWVCQGVAPWDTLPGIADWCLLMCFNTPPHCPPTHCLCTHEERKAVEP